MADSTNMLHIYRQILEGLGSTVMLFNDELKLDYINPAGEMLFEASAKRLQHMALDDLIHTQDSKLLERIHNAARTSHPMTEREVTLLFQGTRTATVDCSITPLLEGPQQKSLLLELQQIDRTLRISREENQLTQNQAIRALLRGLAHEVKNPLGGLRGAAQLLERELPDDSLLEYTGVIIEEADRLRNLVNRMLGPNAIPRMGMINIHEIIEHVENLVRIEFPENLHIKNDYDPSIPELYADRDQLIQALLNIVGNAAEAVGSNGKIILKTRALRKFTIGHTNFKLVCQIDIIDNGPGIDKSMREKIFFPMVTTKMSGTGLGLSIAQSLIQQHNGIIQCKSKPGKTKFSILLPIQDQAQIDQTNESE
jgi:two-component system, NtrC family, nitrogen regulation sensor histidine kinase GlnL